MSKSVAITTFLLATMSVSACAPPLGPLLGPSQAEQNTQGVVSMAKQAVDLGYYVNAERLLAQYVYRNKAGELKLRYFGLSGEIRKEAIDTVVRLLWETGRDDTLKQFADDYLSGDEYQTTLCRISERQASYEQAYQCWNRMGEVDRAERVIRTEAAIRILGTP